MQITSSRSALAVSSYDAAFFVLRLFLAAVMFPHGAQKVLGWFGGPGIEGTVGMFEQMGLPAFVAYLTMAAEFLGSIALALGLLSRVAAFGILCVMVGAIFVVHAEVGFFMNWSGQQSGEGYEYHLLAIGMALAIVIGGGGFLALDRSLRRRKR